MSNIQFLEAVRLQALPASPSANTLYFIKPSGETTGQIYLTNNSGTIVAEMMGTPGPIGDDGDNGWSPILAAVEDNERRVFQITGWQGGEGAAPATGDYLSSTGLTSNIAEATDVRGPTGASGSGTGDMLAATYDSNADGIVNRADIADSVDWANVQNIPNLVESSEVGTAAAADLVLAANIDYNNLTDDEVPTMAGLKAYLMRSIRYIDIRDYGAKPTVDNGPIITTAMASNPNKIVRMPKAEYPIVTSAQITGNNGAVLIGDGNNQLGTVLNMAPNIDAIVISGSQQAGVENLYFQQTAPSNTGNCIKFTGNSFNCFMEKINAAFCTNLYEVDGATETRASKVVARYMQGTHGVKFRGTSASPSYRMFVHDYIADNPYGQGYGALKPYSDNTSYNISDIVRVNGCVFQCFGAGTTGNTGGPVFAQGAVSAFDVFLKDIPDGTVIWRFIMRESLTHFDFDSYAYSLILSNIAAINGGYGLRMHDTVNDGSSYPIWAIVDDLESDHPFFGNVSLEAGEGWQCVNGWYGSVLAGNGFTTHINWRGECGVTNARIAYAAQHGILNNSGIHNRFMNCVVGDNGQSLSNNFHGLISTQDQLQVIGGVYGDIVGVGGNPQYSGIFLGASDHNVIQGVIARGNITTGISDGSGGSNNQILGNVT